MSFLADPTFQFRLQPRMAPHGFPGAAGGAAQPPMMQVRPFGMHNMQYMQFAAAGGAAQPNAQQLYQMQQAAAAQRAAQQAAFAAAQQAMNAAVGTPTANVNARDEAGAHFVKTKERRAFKDVDLSGKGNEARRAEIKAARVQKRAEALTKAVVKKDEAAMAYGRQVVGPILNEVVAGSAAAAPARNGNAPRDLVAALAVDPAADNVHQFFENSKNAKTVDEINALIASMVGTDIS